jgi:toxin YoeB
MNKVFSDVGWADYVYWQTQDKKTLRRINSLLQDIERNGNQGIGNPEPLKGLSGYWSRRINEKDRLVYKVGNDEILIAQCRTHYGDH